MAKNYMLVHRSLNKSGSGPELLRPINQTVTNMTNYRSSNTTVHEDLSTNIDVQTTPMFEAPWPWLEDFGVLIHQSFDPTCSLWLATCTFLPLALSWSPRHKKVWVDLKANESGNRIRRFLGLPEIWIDEIEGELADNWLKRQLAND